MSNYGILNTIIVQEVPYETNDEQALKYQSVKLYKSNRTSLSRLAFRGNFDNRGMDGFCEFHAMNSLGYAAFTVYT